MSNDQIPINADTLVKVYESLRIRFANSLLTCSELEILLSIEKDKNAELEKLLANNSKEPKNKDNV